MGKYRKYKNGIYGIRHDGYYIVPEGEGRKKTGFHVIDENRNLIYGTQSCIEDCIWKIKIGKATDTEKKLIKALYSKEIIELSILFSKLMAKGDKLSKKEEILNRWVGIIRSRKARGLELTEF